MDFIVRQEVANFQNSENPTIMTIPIKNKLTDINLKNNYVLTKQTAKALATSQLKTTFLTG